MNRILVLGLAVVLASATGCGGSSSGGVIASGLTASFTESGTAAGANTVRLTGTPDGDTVTVQLTIGGPTTSADLYSFAFDLVIGDETVAEYVNGSASFGGALTLAGGQSSQALAGQTGDHITLGVSKVGGGTGNGVAAGEEIVVTLDLRLLKEGTTTLTIAGSPPNDPAALDSTGSDVGTVVFDAAAATLIAN
ncbi:MAG: hypothetical protein GY716_18050 [bacterium]|nr:hypothetical protein [bacterium]